MNSVMKASQFDLSQINYSDIKILDSGAKQVYVNYGPDNDRIILHTPRFTLPFNMSVFDKGETPKYSFEASFRDMENYKPLQEFYKKFSEFDTKLIDDGVALSVSWFKKRNTTREVVDALYHAMIKPSRDRETGEPDGKYPPTMRFKLPYRNGRFMFEVYDFNRNPIDLTETPLTELLVKGSKVRALVQCSGLWFASGRYGCTWNVVQLRVKAPARLQNYAFLSDSDDDDDGNTGDASSSNLTGTAVNDSDDDDQVDDDDDDDDSGDSDQDEVVPIKITKKSRRRKN